MGRLGLCPEMPANCSKSSDGKLLGLLGRLGLLRGRGLVGLSAASANASMASSIISDAPLAMASCCWFVNRGGGGSWLSKSDDGEGLFGLPGRLPGLFGLFGLAPPDTTVI